MPSSRRARACARHPQVGDRRRRRSEREWKSGRSRAGIPAKRARRAIGEVRKLLSSSFQIDEGGPILLPGRPFPCVVPCRSLRAEKCARCSQPAWRPSWAVVVVQPRLQERRLNLGATARVQYYLFDVDIGAAARHAPLVTPILSLDLARLALRRSVSWRIALAGLVRASRRLQTCTVRRRRAAGRH